MIFLTITGSWTAAVVYDKQQTKKVRQKWCDLVAHIAQEPLPVNQMPRRLTIFLSAPPGDSISASRRYFKEYVKPVLVAAAMDYDVVEGRKEGDVRYGTAEQIRRLRRKRGEKGPAPAAEDEEPDTEAAIDMIREKMQIVPQPGVRGDLVLGRHTWKEYIRGVHEGWLGPVEEPLPPPPSPPELEAEPSPIHPPTEARTDDPAATTENLEPEKKAEEEEKKEEKKKPSPPPAYLSIDKYSSASLSPNTPSTLEPSQPIYQQHLIGFLKTPQRIYNFLNRRHLADQIGRDTAAIVLASYRPWEQSSAFAPSGDDLDAVPVATRAPESDADGLPSGSGKKWEQQTALASEEPWWHKSVYKSLKEGDETERVLMNDMVIDTRIGERMRKFELAPEEEARANRIASGVEKTRAIPVDDLRKEKVILGSIDEV